MMKTRIIRNMIRCRHCGDVIESKDRHDMKWCSCKTVYVDGGHDYLRRGMAHGAEDYEEMSEIGKESN